MRPQSDPNTERWFARLRNGDREASAALYERLFPRMRSCAILLMGRRALERPAEVDELVHEVFVEVFLRVDRESTARFENLDGLRRYLATAIHHLVVTHVRQRRRRREVSLPTASSPGIAVPGRGPVTSLAIQDTLTTALRRVEAAMVELPEHYRVAISLRYLSGLTSAEIQARLAAADGTPAQYFKSAEQVRTTLYHAMTRLRELMAADAPILVEYFALCDR